MKIFNPRNADLNVFDPHMFVYSPKNIRVAAILVTEDNIGGLAIELEAELQYAAEDAPYFAFYAERASMVEDGAKIHTRVIVKPDYWIIPLRGELHLYHDHQFQTTFVPAPVREENGTVSVNQARRNLGLGEIPELEGWDLAERKEALGDRTKVMVELADGENYYGVVKFFDRDRRMYFVEFEKGGAHDWIEESRVCLDDRKPSPHPRPKNEFDFADIIGTETEITVMYHGAEVRGVIRDMRESRGTESDQDYFVEFVGGSDVEGGNWFAAADIRVAQ